MLGYVQSLDCERRSEALRSYLDDDSKPVEAVEGWSPSAFSRGPTYTYRSKHERSELGDAVEILHTLLLLTEK